MQNPFFLQEAEAEALGQAPEVESEKEEEQPQESDGSSSSEEMFGFGLQSSKGKKVVKSKPSGNGTSRKSTAVAKPQQTTDPEASIMAKAKDTLEILEKVCPLAVWQGSMKEKDVDAKLNKGLGIAGQISSSLEASDECKSLGSKLEKSAEEITETLGVLSTMKTKINAISGDGNATALACEAMPPWVTDAKQACQRLEMLLDKSGRDKLKALANEAHGVSGALDWIQSEKLVMTPGLQQCVDVLKQAKLLKDTGAEFTVPVKEDLKGTCVCVKNMLTICSLQIEDIKFFFPDAAEHVATFQSTVEAHMEGRFVMIERWVRAGKEMITKFRLEW